MEILTEQANAIAGILVEENILHRTNDVYGELTLRDFITSTIAYPENESINFALELTYDDANTRIITKFRRSGDTYRIHSVDAFAYRGETTKGVDYDAVNGRIAAYLG